MTFTMDLEEKQASDLDHNKCVWREENEKNSLKKKIIKI